jgi:hypothetical protein
MRLNEAGLDKCFDDVITYEDLDIIPDWGTQLITGLTQIKRAFIIGTDARTELVFIRSSISTS